MKASRPIILSFLSILFSLGAITLSSPVKAQQLDKPDLIQSFPVGHSPVYLAFDGANIWVTNSDDNTVTKLRASDGAPQGTFAVGDVPAFITFDGENIWVGN